MEINFNNFLDYNKDKVKNDKEYVFHTLNLSSVKYSFRVKIGDNNSDVFDIGSIFKSYNLLKKITISGNDRVFIHPEILNLANVFDFKLTSFPIKNNEIIIKGPENKIIIEMSEISKQIDKLFKEITKFLKDRDNVLNYKNINCLSSYDNDFNKEFLRILDKIIKNDYYVSENIEFNDFLYNNGFCYGRTVYTEELYPMYNYEKLSILLKKLALTKNEFFILQEYESLLKQKENIEKILLKRTLKKKESESLKFINTNLDRMNDIMDDVNSSYVFTKETFAMFYVVIEDFVKKEKTLNSFVDKILNNEFLTRINI